MEAVELKYKTYPAYKDSCVEWLGEVPEGWLVIPGLTILFENKEKNTGMKRNTVLSLSYGKIRVKAEEELTGLVPESFETYQLVNKGDIIFRPTDLQNDKVSLRSGMAEDEGIITSAYLNLRFKPIANKKFYSYLFRAIDNNKVIYGLGSGLRQNIDYRDFRRFLFPFPPLPEQTAIANFLDNKTTKIDQAIAQKQKLIELLKERKQILIQDAVTGKVVWSKKHQKFVPLALSEVEGKDSGVEWIGEIPEGWEVCSVKYILSIPITDGPHETPELIKEGIPFISAEAVKNGKIDFDKKRGFISEKEHKRFCEKYKPKYGDIYMVKSGATTGNIAMVETENEFSIWSPLAVFRTKKDVIIKKYLYFFLTSYSFKRGVELKWSFGTQQNIGMGVLSNLPIAFCSKKEQKQIVSYIETQSAKIDKAIALQQTQIEKLKEYKAVLIDSAVRGRIKVV